MKGHVCVIASLNGEPHIFKSTSMAREGADRKNLMIIHQTLESARNAGCLPILVQVGSGNNKANLIPEDVAIMEGRRHHGEGGYYIVLHLAGGKWNIQRAPWCHERQEIIEGLCAHRLRDPTRRYEAIFAAKREDVQRYIHSNNFMILPPDHQRGKIPTS